MKLEKTLFALGCLACLLFVSCDGLIDSPTEGVVENTRDFDANLQLKISLDLAAKVRGEQAMAEFSYSADFFEYGILVYPERVAMNGDELIRSYQPYDGKSWSYEPISYKNFKSMPAEEFLNTNEYLWEITGYYDSLFTIRQQYNGIPRISRLSGFDTISKSEFLELQLMGNSFAFVNILYSGYIDENGEYISDLSEYENNLGHGSLKPGEKIIDWHSIQRYPDNSIIEISLDSYISSMTYYGFPFSIHSRFDFDSQYLIHLTED